MQILKALFEYPLERNKMSFLRKKEIGQFAIGQGCGMFGVRESEGAAFAKSIAAENLPTSVELFFKN